MTQPKADDAPELERFLRALPVGTVRTLAAGMRYRSEYKKAEIIDWLVRYNPGAVRQYRDGR